MQKFQPTYCQFIIDSGGRQLRWFNRLSKRLEAHRVPQLLPLVIAVRVAYNAMHTVRIHSMCGAMERSGNPNDPPDDPQTEAMSCRME